MGVSQYQELKEHDDILQKALSIRDGGRDGTPADEAAPAMAFCFLTCPAAAV